MVNAPQQLSRRAPCVLAVLACVFGAAINAAACDAGGNEPAPVASRTAPAANAGELRILALVGPSCPVERADSPCPDRPIEATIVIRNAVGAELTRARTGGDGYVNVTLPPGTYHLEPQSPGGITRAEPVDVTVVAGETTQATIRYDSGIR